MLRMVRAGAVRRGRACTDLAQTTVARRCGHGHAYPPALLSHACMLGVVLTIMWRTDVDVSAVRRWAGGRASLDQFAKVHQTGPER